MRFWHQQNGIRESHRGKHHTNSAEAHKNPRTSPPKDTQQVNKARPIGWRIYSIPKRSWTSSKTLYPLEKRWYHPWKTQEQKEVLNKFSKIPICWTMHLIKLKTNGKASNHSGLNIIYIKENMIQLATLRDPHWQFQDQIMHTTR